MHGGMTINDEEEVRRLKGVEEGEAASPHRCGAGRKRSKQESSSCQRLDHIT